MPHRGRIKQDQRALRGKSRIRGALVSVGTIVGHPASGDILEEIPRENPYLERDDIEAAPAQATLRCEEVILWFSLQNDPYRRGSCRASLRKRHRM